MARLSQNGSAQFMILDAVQIYDEAELDRICDNHDISAESTRMALWRTLEEAGRQWRDQRRLQATRTQISRLKQELQLGLRLAGQLGHHIPASEQLREDQAGVGLSRHHLAALREGERRVGAETGEQPRCRLEDAGEMLAYIGQVYEEALAACAAGGSEDPDAAWRARLKAFYTRTLARAWVTREADQGERFLAECHRALDAVECEAAPAEAAPCVRAGQAAG